MTIFVTIFYRKKLNQEYSQQFVTLFQQWEMDIQKTGEQKQKLAVSIILSFIIYYKQVSSRNGEPNLVGDP